MPTIELEQIAHSICKRGLAAPAIFFLEAFKPLTTVVHSASMASAPLLQMFLGLGFQRGFSDFLQDRENVEKLICLIEQQGRQEPNVRI